MGHRRGRWQSRREPGPASRARCTPSANRRPAGLDMTKNVPLETVPDSHPEALGGTGSSSSPRPAHRRPRPQGAVLGKRCPASESLLARALFASPRVEDRALTTPSMPEGRGLMDAVGSTENNAARDYSLSGAGQGDLAERPTVGRVCRDLRHPPPPPRARSARAPSCCRHEQALLRPAVRARGARERGRGEIAFHLEQRIEQYVRRGLSPERAREAALRRFGRLDDAHDIYLSAQHRENRMRVRELLDALRHDARQAVRSIRMSPGFTIVIALTLAVGIGAYASSARRRGVLRPFPYPASTPRRGPVHRQSRAFPRPKVLDWLTRGTGVFSASRLLSNEDAHRHCGRKCRRLRTSADLPGLPA